MIGTPTSWQHKRPNTYLTTGQCAAIYLTIPKAEHQAVWVVCRKLLSDPKPTNISTRTTADRQGRKRKFSVDFMKRCTAEYNQTIRTYRGDTEKRVNVLSFATDAIIDSYSSRCGRTCVHYSLVYNGAPEKCWPKE